MKKLLTVIILTGTFYAGAFAQAPVIPEPLPNPAWYTPEEIFNNSWSSATLKFNCNVDGSSISIKSMPQVDIKSMPAVSVTGSTISVTGSTVSIANMPAVDIKSMPAVGVTGSTISIANMPAVDIKSMPAVDVNGSTISIANMPAVDIKSMPAVDVNGSTISIANMPAVDIKSMPAVDVNGSTVSIANMPVVIVQDNRYYQKVSSGTSGTLTGITSAAIVVTENIYSWSFKYRNLVNKESIAVINPDLYGTGIALFDGDGDSENPAVPKAITFSITMPVESTMTYVINTVK